MLLFAKIVMRRLLHAVFTAPFRMKGAVLRGATLTVHSVTRSEPPPIYGPDQGGEGALQEDEAADPAAVEAEREPRDYYWIDATITPTALPGAFRLWEPGEILFVPPDAKEGDVETEEESGHIEGLEVFQDGAFVKDEGFKFEGPQRVRNAGRLETRHETGEAALLF